MNPENIKESITFIDKFDIDEFHENRQLEQAKLREKTNEVKELKEEIKRRNLQEMEKKIKPLQKKYRLEAKVRQSAIIISIFLIIIFVVAFPILCLWFIAPHFLIGLGSTITVGIIGMIFTKYNSLKALTKKQLESSRQKIKLKYENEIKKNY